MAFLDEPCRKPEAISDTKWLANEQAVPKQALSDITAWIQIPQLLTKTAIFFARQKSNSEIL